MRKITHSIRDYFALNQMRKNTHWRYVDDKLMFEHEGVWYDKDVFEHEGVWYDKDVFDEIYPQYDYKPFNDKGHNPGKTYA